MGGSRIVIYKAQQPVQVTTGDLTVSETPATPGVMKTRGAKSTVDRTLPAGAYHVSIRATTYQKPVTVNGQSIHLGDAFNASFALDEATNTQDLLPPIVIEAGGNEYFFSVAYPSASPVDVSNI